MNIRSLYVRRFGVSPFRQTGLKREAFPRTFVPSPPIPYRPGWPESQDGRSAQSALSSLFPSPGPALPGTVGLRYSAQPALRREARKNRGFPELPCLSGREKILRAAPRLSDGPLPLREPWEAAFPPGAWPPAWPGLIESALLSGEIETRSGPTPV